MPASVVLVGGDPGIGKSTLMLQAAACLARSGRRVLYVSPARKPIDQVRLRARRLGVADSARSSWLPRSMSATSPPAWSRPKDTTLVVIDSHPDHVAGQRSTAPPAAWHRCAPAASN